jgi:hypothetical protein
MGAVLFWGKRHQGLQNMRYTHLMPLYYSRSGDVSSVTHLQVMKA